MLPVVPKVRVGDVLHSTRNLRNWLQTASMYFAVRHMSEVGSIRGSKGILYAPSKDDRYVVCVNTGLVFAAFMPEKEMTLFFVNPMPQGQQSPEARVTGVVLPRPTHYDTRTKSKKQDADETRMSPAIFSTWFVRTGERVVDLKLWPDYAYATWASLQMNAVSSGGDYRLAISIPRSNDHLFYPHQRAGALGNFGSGKRMKDRSTIRTCLQYAIKTGMTRARYQTGLNNPHVGIMGRASGPRMVDIENYRKEIRGHLRNPRIRKAIEGQDLEGDTIKFILDGIKNKKNS